MSWNPRPRRTVRVMALATDFRISLYFSPRPSAELHMGGTRWEAQPDFTAWPVRVLRWPIRAMVPAADPCRSCLSLFFGDATGLRQWSVLERVAPSLSTVASGWTVL